MESKKLTHKDALDVVQAFAKQSKKNVAFGLLADTEGGNIATFIKGEESEVLALITMQMAKEEDFRNLIYKAMIIFGSPQVKKIIKKYEQAD